MSAIRVLVADDHVFYREGIKRMLGDHAEGIEVVAEATTGDEAVRSVEGGGIDVVLMDLKMPGLNGIEATRQIHAAHPDLAILVLTMFDDDSVFTAMRAGARGYLLKHADVDDLSRAITAVHRGEAIFSPAIARRLSRFFTELASAGSPDLFPELTGRERDVLKLLSEELSNGQIAARLGLNQKTVRNYVANVLAKLHVHDRAEAAGKAQDAGLN